MEHSPLPIPHYLWGGEPLPTPLPVNVSRLPPTPSRNPKTAAG